MKIVGLQFYVQTGDILLYMVAHTPSTRHVFPTNQPRRFAHSVTTSDPVVWGPFFWTYLHIMARHYAESPSSDQQSHMLAFLHSFPATLPCVQCRRHAVKYMREHEETLNSSVLSRRNLMQFLWKMHNAVNARTGKRQLSWSQVQHLYDARQVRR